MRQERAGVQYAKVEGVDPEQDVYDVTARWAEQEELNVCPSLITLRLVNLCGPDVPTASEEAAATALNPRRTLREAGVADGSSLLACVSEVSVPPSSRAGSGRGSSRKASSALALALGSVTARLCIAARN